ncbi:hypothetical protein IV417_02125 [Alphaproteobacteria bacterium KMM 3653]|uniref:Excalibur calcium-binding domain-containing protein n=1 Tax=Harenicola maris TaxID=2841044 RepID=A0AAP2G6D2_9RHOB|nr:hypothetical protein [Harenicola maris]
MTRIWLSFSAAFVLGACAAPPVPDSGAGVGFNDYGTYQSAQAQARAEREAALSGTTTVQTPGYQEPLSSTVPSNGAPSAAEINAALNNGPASDTISATPAPITTSATASAPVATNAAGISREQNFDAVSDLRGIESDAALRQQQQAQYQQVAPTALPTRPSDTGPNLANFALSTTNAMGEKIYRRGFTTEARHNRNCSSYPSPSEAQVAFLSEGGPQRDRKGLDPDGDGFACAWDPRPFRAAAQG